MLELIAPLRAGTRVLDLGAGAGSFEIDRADLCLVRADLSIPAERKSGIYVCADAGWLPFKEGAFDVLISNHSLEHFLNLRAALAEIARVLKPEGALYVAVPDAGTLADRIYRWLMRDGGHVNAFRSSEQVIALITEATGLDHCATNILFSSFSYLNARNFTGRQPRRMALFAYGDERFLMVFTWILRHCDRLFGTRLSRYGWTFYFGNARFIPGGQAWSNVCIRCGSAHAANFLLARKALRKTFGIWHVYGCPACGALNLFTPEFYPTSGQTAAGG